MRLFTLRSRSALLLGLTLLAGTGHAQQEFLTVIPTNPLSTDQVRVEMGGVWRDSCVPSDPQVTPSGSTIRIRLRIVSGVCLAALTPWRHNVSLGKLAPGTYELIVEIADVNGVRVFGTRSFTVFDANQVVRISPTSGPIAGGHEVTITGNAVADCSGITICLPPSVTFGDVSAGSIRVVDNNTIVAVTPANRHGWVGVSVRDTAGRMRTAEGFYYFDPSVERDPAAYARVLFPVFFFGPGAFGSRWATDIWIHNDSLGEVTPYRDLIFTFCFPDDPCTRPIPRQSAVQLSERNQSRPSGILFYPPREAQNLLSYSIHIRDLSRQDQTWGTEIPVVREGDFRTDPITLLNLPADPLFRQTLRIYDPDSKDGSEVLLRVYRMTSDFPFAQRIVTLRTSLRCILPCGPNVDEPAYAQVDLGPLVQGFVPARVEIVPLTSGLRFWAFVTVTSNDTQQVTTITPQ